MDYYSQLGGILREVSVSESDLSINGQTIPAGIGDGVLRDHIVIHNPGSQLSVFSHFVVLFIIGIIISLSAVASSINNTVIFAGIFVGAVHIITLQCVFRLGADSVVVMIEAMTYST
jgi:hypothetical protein